MLQEMMRGLLVGAVGTTLRWLGRLLRNGLIAFVLGGGGAFGIGAGVMRLSVGRVPDTASWLLLGAIALIVALLSALTTMTITVMRSLGRAMGSTRGGTPGAPVSAPPTTRDNVRVLPTTRAKRRVS